MGTLLDKDEEERLLAEEARKPKSRRSVIREAFQRRFLTYRELQDAGIVPNRVTLARAIEQLGFPPPYEFGGNRLAWSLEEVEIWLSTRPRRFPKVWKPDARVPSSSRPRRKVWTPPDPAINDRKKAAS